MRPKLIFLLLITLLISVQFTSCKTTKEIAKEEVVMLEEPKILFLNYTIHKLSETDSELRFVSRILADGELKHSGALKSKAEIGDLIFSQLATNDLVLDSLIMDNPLIKHVEYVNDDNELAIKKVRLEEAQITLRLQLNLAADRIRIEEITSENKRTLLGITQIHTDG